MHLDIFAENMNTSEYDPSIEAYYSAQIQQMLFRPTNKQFREKSVPIGSPYFCDEEMIAIADLMDSIKHFTP